MTTTTTVALIGLGAMGVRIAQNLINAGHSIIVHNYTVKNHNR